MKLVVSKFFVPTDSEVAANHAGLNTFFGAVLGFVMAGTERLDSLEFAYVLFIISGAVIAIIYVSTSHQKVLYSLLALLLIFLLPQICDPFLEPDETLPDKLQPTLLVWTILTIFVEVLPRRPEDLPRPSAET